MARARSDRASAGLSRRYRSRNRRTRSRTAARAHESPHAAARAQATTRSAGAQPLVVVVAVVVVGALREGRVLLLVGARRAHRYLGGARRSQSKVPRGVSPGDALRGELLVCADGMPHSRFNGVGRHDDGGYNSPRTTSLGGPGRSDNSLPDSDRRLLGGLYSAEQNDGRHPERGGHECTLFAPRSVERDVRAPPLRRRTGLHARHRPLRMGAAGDGVAAGWDGGRRCHGVGPTSLAEYRTMADVTGGRPGH